MCFSRARLAITAADCGKLKTYFIRSLIDRNVFAGPLNAGHLAIADLALTRATVAVISTNVDGLIEGAGQQLFGEIFDNAVRNDGLAAVSCGDHNPFLSELAAVGASPQGRYVNVLGGYAHNTRPNGDRRGGNKGRVTA